MDGAGRYRTVWLLLFLAAAVTQGANPDATDPGSPDLARIIAPDRPARLDADPDEGDRDPGRNDERDHDEVCVQPGSRRTECPRRNTAKPCPTSPPGGL